MKTQALLGGCYGILESIYVITGKSLTGKICLDFAVVCRVFYIVNRVFWMVSRCLPQVSLIFSEI